MVLEPTDNTEEDEEQLLELKGRTDAHKYPTILGTMVHRFMEVVVLSKNKADPMKIVDDIIEEYAIGIDDSDKKILSESIKTVAKTITTGGFEQETSIAQDILKELLDAEEVYCEVPFAYDDTTENIIYNGVMDVIYKSAGKWHIVDYKTNIKAEHLDEKYKGQLDAYKKAFKILTGEDADAWIYHIAV